MITLLTDFGTQDTFVGVMKGVIKSITPTVDMIDLTHEIPPQDIRAGAFALKTAVPYFPPGTIHMVIVDPGVGSTRCPIAAHIGDAFYICPDNGLLSYVLAEHTLHAAVLLDNTQYQRSSISRTFHGRDIFAPAAAYLADGVPLDTLGTPLETLTTLPLAYPHVSPDVIQTHIVYIDTYGNVFTDLTEDIYHPWGSPNFTFLWNGHVIHGPANSYSDVPVGTPVMLFGSSGHLEIAVRNGSARDTLGLAVGDTILLKQENG